MLFAWATAVALLMSTEFLFQPFVWRDYELSEIWRGWLAIARDRLVTALTIALALAPLRRSNLPGVWRILPYVGCIVVGATAGETLLSWFRPEEDRQDLISVMGRVTRWTLVGGATAIMLQLWRSGAALAAATEESRIQDALTHRLAASSQLETLRRQIEPHFLFNTLATIRRLHETDPQRGQILIGRLFHYMSATLTQPAPSGSTLGAEIALVQAYLDVCASRMGGRLVVLTELEPGLGGVDFPPLVLATLVENAVKHGIFPQDGGTISIRARRLGDLIETAVIDNGVGLSSETGGAGLGLANISERLRLLYGAKAELTLHANPDHGVTAIVRIPSQTP